MVRDEYVTKSHVRRGYLAKYKKQKGRRAYEVP